MIYLVTVELTGYSLLRSLRQDSTPYYKGWDLQQGRTRSASEVVTVSAEPLLLLHDVFLQTRDESQYLAFLLFGHLKLIE